MSKRIPEGYIEDAKGNLVHISNVKQVDLDRDALVRGIVAQAEPLCGQIATFREAVLDMVDNFVAESMSRYKAKFGGIKGNVNLMTFDGDYKVVVSVQENIAFDERLQVAKELIDKCLKKWAEGARPEILTLISSAFQVDKAGLISTSRVLGLRKLDITDPDWKRAMEAISESLNVVNSKRYIRIYKQLENGGYKLVPLDLATS